MLDSATVRNGAILFGGGIVNGMGTGDTVSDELDLPSPLLVPVPPFVGDTDCCAESVAAAAVVGVVSDGGLNTKNSGSADASPFDIF